MVKCNKSIHPIGSIHISDTSIEPSNTFGGSWKLLYKVISLKYSYGEEFNIKSSIYRYSMQYQFKCIKGYINKCTNYSLLRNKINKTENDLFKVLYVWERTS